MFSDPQTMALAFLRRAYSVLDQIVLSRLSESLERRLKEALVSIGATVFPGRISHASAASLMVRRVRPPLGSSAPIPDWARVELSALAKEVDPALVLHASPPCHVVMTNDCRAMDAYRFIRSQLPDPCDVLFVVPWLKIGGADLATLHHVRVVHSMGLSVAVLATEPHDSPWRDRLPPEVRFVEAGAVLAGLGDFRQAALVLARWVVQVRPKMLHLMGSRVGWDALKLHGAAIASSSAVAASLYCDDEDESGKPLGLAVSHLPDAFTYLSVIFSDNALYPERWSRRWGLPKSLFITLDLPAPPVTELGGSAPALVFGPPTPNRPRILWAGRFDRQKRLDVLWELVSRTPDCDWDIHGQQVVPGHGFDISRFKCLPNAYINGPYGRFEDIVRPEHVAFVYTSQWDGIPNVVLEAARLLPVIAPRVGGLPTVIHPELLVHDVFDLEGYLERISRLRTESDWAASVYRSQQRILDRRTAQSFADSLEPVIRSLLENRSRS